MGEPNNLADALAFQIARVTAKKERWQKLQREYNMDPGMQLSINIMGVTIENGIKALASGDVMEIMEAHQYLADYNDDD